MTQGIYNICLMDVIGTFYDEVEAKIKKAIRKAHNRCITVELTFYADYCVRLLQNNGWAIEENADDILQFMWHACPMLVLNNIGYHDFSGNWNYDNGTFELIIYLG